MKLSEKLDRYRIDRPDEWTMDEFARQARQLEEMLDIAWDAVTEAGYEGFSYKLKDFMEE